MKLDYPKEWFLRSAEIEGDSEIGAGTPPWNREQINQSQPCGMGSRIAFSQFVALWRRNQRWSTERLANEAGIDLEEVLQIESDSHCEPEPDAVFKLAHVFGVAPKALMEIAGLRTSRSSKLRDKAIRFAASSESISELEPHEREALEAFAAALAEYPNE